MDIAVIGTGYVGLVTGAGLSDFGNDVICVDVDVKKIEALRKGLIPIYEPGLDKIVNKNVHEGRLRFTTDLAEAIRTARASSSRSARPRSRTARPTCATSRKSPAPSPNT